MNPIPSPIVGTVVRLAEVGTRLAPGEPAVVLESMKMEHPVALDGGEVLAVHVAPGDVVEPGTPLVELAPIDAADAPVEPEVDNGGVRADLAEVRHRHEIGLDDHRESSVQKRHERGFRTARENIEALIDPGSLIE